MTYVARSRVGTPPGGEWVIDGPPGFVSLGGLSEAEANIYAFSLNAVSEGLTLQASVAAGNTIAGWPLTKVIQYDGPTEGVAP